MKSQHQLIVSFHCFHLNLVGLSINANQSSTIAYSNHEELSDDLLHFHRDALRCFFFFLDAEDEAGSAHSSGMSGCSSCRTSSPILSGTGDERQSLSALGDW